MALTTLAVPVVVPAARVAQNPVELVLAPGASACHENCEETVTVPVAGENVPFHSWWSSPCAVEHDRPGLDGLA